MIKVNRKSTVAFWTNHNMIASQQRYNEGKQDSSLIRAFYIQEARLQQEVLRIGLRTTKTDGNGLVNCK